ncbi:MAG: hypothetical protein WCG23_04400 [bacterium]
MINAVNSSNLYVNVQQYNLNVNSTQNTNGIWAGTINQTNLAVQTDYNVGWYDNFNKLYGNVINIINQQAAEAAAKKAAAEAAAVAAQQAAAQKAADAAAAAAKTPQQMSDAELRAAWVAAGSIPNDKYGTELHNRGLWDPYEVNIDGKNYIFTRDTNGNNKVDGKQEILGINDTKDNLFADMKSLDTNKDGKVSTDELTAAGVSLNEVLDGKISNRKYDLNKISGVDLRSFSAIDNTNSTGIFGTFTLNLKNGSTARGKETFEDQDYFNKLFA